ncbi:MAG: hypothetical protein AAGJ28_25455, partial [Pseudomonadota bacterium]
RHVLTGMAEEAGVDFDHSPAGILHFYKTRAELEKARKVTALYAEAGLKREELTPDEVRAKEPKLTGQFAGGYLTANCPVSLGSLALTSSGVSSSRFNPASA